MKLNIANISAKSCTTTATTKAKFWRASHHTAFNNYHMSRKMVLFMLSLNSLWKLWRAVHVELAHLGLELIMQVVTGTMSMLSWDYDLIMQVATGSVAGSDGQFSLTYIYVGACIIAFSMQIAMYVWQVVTVSMVHVWTNKKKYIYIYVHSWWAHWAGSDDVVFLLSVFTYYNILKDI